MKNNKGFAISSVVYAMLVLFLGLILLILGNLASRKAMFDKEKKDILSRFNNGDNVEELCTLTEGNLYEAGSKYVCDVGDGELKTFYALETNGDNVSLIMNANVDSNGKAITPDNIPDDKGLMAWCGDETLCKTNGDWDNTKGPITAKAALLTRTTGWTKLKNNQITLPSQAQISGAYTGTMPMWLYDYLDSTTNSVPNVYGYWTSTKDATYLSNVITVRYIGQLTYGFVYSDTYCGIRPAITILKSQIKVSQATTLCEAVTSATTGNVPSGSYAYGDEYTCDLGDGEERTFFVLEESGDNVLLIMNSNIGSAEKVLWCKSGSDNSCSGDGALEYLNSSTKLWTKLNQSQITLPTASQIATASGMIFDGESDEDSEGLSTWLYVNLNSDTGPFAYWTLTPVVWDSSFAWVTLFVGSISVDNVDLGEGNGVRPVITIPKSQVKNPVSTTLCKGVTTATAGNVPSGSYAYGDEYTCELGDGEEKTFFVLEKDGDDVSLIMNMNVDENGKGTLLGNNVSWCKSGSNNSCGADGALEHLSTSTKSWTKLNQSQITLPSGQQIATAGGDSVWSSSKYGSGFESKTWLHVNLSESHEYWTSTSYSSNNNGAWSVNSYGELGVNDITDTPLGVRPVIKISSSQIQ